MKILILSAVFVMNVFAACDTSLNVDLFSKPFDNVLAVKGYEKVLKKLDYLKYDLNGGGKYHIEISAGAMKEQVPNLLNNGVTERVLLLSDIIVTNRDNEIIFRDIKKRRVSDTNVEAKKIVKFIKRHISKKLPFCTKK